MIGAVESLRVLQAGVPPGSPLGGACSSSSSARARTCSTALRRDDDARRSWQLADLLIACLRGIVARRAARRPVGASRASTTSTSASGWRATAPTPETLDSPLVRGMYDLVFAYEGGDPQRPRFAAGLGLFLSYKLFFDYKGAIFWKLRAGMGDVVFAPLYEALRARGVRFAFFHRVERLHLDRRRRGRVVSLMRHPAGPDYEPLVRVGAAVLPVAAVAAPARGGTTGRRRGLRRVMLATSLGVLPASARELLERLAALAGDDDAAWGPSRRRRCRSGCAPARRSSAGRTRARR